jgi:hypothetical protein
MLTKKRWNNPKAHLDTESRGNHIITNVMAKVTLRIVGLYFNETFEMAINETTNVQKVVDEYIELKHDLSYGVQPNGSLASFTYDFNGKYNFNGFSGTGPEDGPTLNNKNLQAGTYTLAEAMIEETKTLLAWQYYVVAKSGTVKSKTKASRGFKFWNQAPDYLITDGDTIIWRLVAIYDAPYAEEYPKA